MSLPLWQILLEKPLDGAACASRLDLPWTADREPDYLLMTEMRKVCGQCPVISKCAERALDGHSKRGAEGGMYAGIWLPWMSSYDSEHIKYVRKLAKKTLRRIATLGQ